MHRMLDHMMGEKDKGKTDYIIAFGKWNSRV